MNFLPIADHLLIFWRCTIGIMRAEMQRVSAVIATNESV